MGLFKNIFDSAVDRVEQSWTSVTDTVTSAASTVYDATIGQVKDTSIADFEAGLEHLRSGGNTLIADLADIVTTPLQIAKRVTGDEGRLEPVSWSQAVLDAAPTVAKPVAGFLGLNTLTTEEKIEADRRRAEEINVTRKLTEAIEESNERDVDDEEPSGRSIIPEVTLTEGQKTALQVAGIGLAAVSVLITAGAVALRSQEPRKKKGARRVG